MRVRVRVMVRVRVGNRVRVRVAKFAGMLSGVAHATPG